jgi:hypothetical protein
MPLTVDQSKDALKTFNAKLEKMLSYSFFKHGKISLAVQHDLAARKATIDSDYTSDEALDAVILNLRFFILHRKYCSYHKLQPVYATIQPPPELQKEFDAAYAQWTVWNQTPSGILDTTNERLFEIIFYGVRAHRNCRANYEDYDEWKENVLLFETAMVRFCGKIDELVGILKMIYAVNQKVLSSELALRTRVAWALLLVSGWNTLKHAFRSPTCVT